MQLLELKIPPAAMAALTGLVMWVVSRLTPGLHFALPGAPFLAVGLTLAGVLIALLGVAFFRRARTTVNPLSPGTSSALVCSGIYRRSRNPMYLGMLLVLFAEAALLANALVWVLPVVFVFLMTRLQILPEERALAALFGAEFSTYKTKVRRWL